MKSKTIPKNIREKNAEFREIIAKLEAAEGNEEAGFIPRPLGTNPALSLVIMKIRNMSICLAARSAWIVPCASTRVMAGDWM